MKKSLILSALILLTALMPVKADEGMWLPMLIKRLNQRNLQEMGLQLTPEEIYSVNQSSLKDAIVSMGGFCTGEIISKNGLMLTNHHCGYDAIRENSTVENDILTNGFWAANYSQELPNEGLFVSFLVRMEDVTAEILPQLEGIESEAARNQKIGELSRAIAARAEEGTHYNAEVKSFYVGNEFYLFVYERFTDVRLVGTPPESVGKFGGDTDNWMWPRHTGDFSLFRVYTGPDGKPAEYSENNIPLKPKHHLPVSLTGVEDGDFAMTFGFPGSTDRYLSSFGIKQALDKKNPTIVEIRDAKLAALREDMKNSDAVRLMYASKYAQIANYWKYFIGQTEQLKELNVAATKEALEADFQKWADADPARKAKYGEALSMLERGFAMKDNTVVGGTYVLEAGLVGADIILFTYRMSQQMDAYMALEAGTEKDEMKDALKIATAEFFEGVNLPTDKKLFAVTQELYSKNVPLEQQPAYMRALNGKQNGKWDKYADKAYAKSIFADKVKLTAFIENPNEKVLEKDPLRIVANDLFEIYRGQGQANAEANELLAKGNRLFQEGLRKMMPEKDFYPDANSTLRASFGNVKSYEPKDGVMYKYYTTLDGKLSKENPNDDEFIVPEGISKLHAAGNYGQYADADGQLRINFISTNDITGGNSGSPVINGKGELIGLAFDGNWEAMSGDINFEKSIQRTISVDIRYVLWIIDKYAGAKHLIDEMTLVKSTGGKGNKLRSEAVNAMPSKEIMSDSAQ
jgi:hypothetical protein